MDIKKKPKKKKNVAQPQKVTTKKKEEAGTVSNTVKIISYSVGTIWVSAIVVLSAGLVYSVVYANSTFPGTNLAGENLSGMSRSELQAEVQDQLTDLRKQQWDFDYESESYTAKSGRLGLQFQTDTTINEIWSYGRSGNFLVNVGNQLVGLFGDPEFKVQYNIDQEQLNTYAEDHLADVVEKPTNADLAINESMVVQHVPAVNGRRIDQPYLLIDLDAAIQSGSNPKIDLRTYETEPEITNEKAQASTAEVISLLSDSITLTNEDSAWTIEPEQIATWISTDPAEVRIADSSVNEEADPFTTDIVYYVEGDEIEYDYTDPSQKSIIPTMTNEDVWNIVQQPTIEKPSIDLRERILEDFSLANRIETDAPMFLLVGLDKNVVAESLLPISDELNVDGQNARLAYSDGKVVVVEESVDGQAVNTEQALNDIVELLQDKSKDREIALFVQDEDAEVTEGNYRKLGITDFLGRGESNFSGSSSTRIHNIRTAVDRFDGILIAPENEFSFVTTLGDVDGTTGYLQELVIKENKVIPEFGGGVCQVSTTMFRAAVESGLDITQRKNHAFVVSYYGTPGTDATIYVPSPDMTFINNTPGYILVQPWISGTTLVFDFYGKHDGREVITEGPYQYGNSSGGTSTSWTQIVYNDAGQEYLRQTFDSYYRPASDFSH
ncbi:VanW family protein [Patescibacteria group bacterium]